MPLSNDFTLFILFKYLSIAYIPNDMPMSLNTYYLSSYVLVYRLISSPQLTLRYSTHPILVKWLTHLILCVFCVSITSNHSHNNREFKLHSSFPFSLSHSGLYISLRTLLSKVLNFWSKKSLNYTITHWCYSYSIYYDFGITGKWLGNQRLSHGLIIWFH